MISNKNGYISFPKMPTNNWSSILSLLKETEYENIRKSICVSCGTGKLYDDNGKIYTVFRYMSIEGVRYLLSEINKINEEKRAIHTC